MGYNTTIQLATSVEIYTSFSALFSEDLPETLLPNRQLPLQLPTAHEDSELYGQQTTAHLPPLYRTNWLTKSEYACRLPPVKVELPKTVPADLHSRQRQSYRSNRL